MISASGVTAVEQMTPMARDRIEALRTAGLSNSVVESEARPDANWSRGASDVDQAVRDTRVRRARLLALFAVLNLTGFGLVGAAGAAGWLELIWRADSSRLTAVITVLFLAGLGICTVIAFKRKPARELLNTVPFVADSLVLLGLIGTVLGFIMALSGVDPAVATDAKAVQPMIVQLIGGMGVALYTTLVGGVLYLWLSINYRLMSAHHG